MVYQSIESGDQLREQTSDLAGYIEETNKQSKQAPDHLGFRCSCNEAALGSFATHRSISLGLKEKFLQGNLHTDLTCVSHNSRIRSDLVRK